MSDQTVLFKLDAHNSGGWVHFTSDNINSFIGKNVKLLFGTYNDTTAGVTAMYVDDVALEYCVALDAPAPDSPLAPVEVE